MSRLFTNLQRFLSSNAFTLFGKTLIPSKISNIFYLNNVTQIVKLSYNNNIEGIKILCRKYFLFSGFRAERQGEHV